MSTGQDEERGAMGRRAGESTRDTADRLWSFATAVYADAAVARACLRMQDAHGFDVNLLLFAAWCAHEGRLLKVSQMAQAEARCEAWRRDVVLPLRGTRRRWKGAAERAADYPAIKELEIAAERRQLEMLAALVADRGFLHASDGEDVVSSGNARLAKAPGALARNLAAVAALADTDPAVLGDLETALRSALAGLQSAARNPPD